MNILQVAITLNVSNKLFVPYLCYKLLNSSQLSIERTEKKYLQINWHKLCTYLSLMKVSDLLIIYLACGAPLGVYFFTSNKKSLSKGKLWLKTILVFIFWFPFFLGLFYKENFFGKFLGFTNNEDTNGSENYDLIENKILSIQKNVERIIKQSEIKLSIYEFRNIFERYAGLSLALCDQTAENNREESVFGISGHNNVELAQICQNRRNRRHLSFHQINALEDFLKVIRQLSFFKSGDIELQKLSFELVTLLNDERAETGLVEIFGQNQQTQKAESVKQAEEELWKTEQHEQLHANRLTIRLKAMHPLAATNSRKKD